MEDKLKDAEAALEKALREYYRLVDEAEDRKRSVLRRTGAGEAAGTEREQHDREAAGRGTE